MAIVVETHPAYLAHDTGPGHPERPARLDAVLAGLEAAGVPDALVWAEPRRATRAELERVHPAAHLDELEAFCAAGGGRIDADTNVGPTSWDAALLAAGAGLDAVERLERGDGSAGFCVVRPPGHHATPERAMGFCLLNNVAVAAAALADRGERVLVYDWDAHHGNGTQDAFYADRRVLYVSAHQWPLYPGTGALDETGRGPGAGYTINLPFPPGTTGDVYLAAFDEVVAPAVERFDPTWVVVSAGFDAHRADGLLQSTPFDVVKGADTERMAFAIMPKERADEFMSHSEADFAHSVSGMGRFRVNVFRQRGSVGLVFRRVLPGTPSFEALGLPPVVRRLAEEPRGMILVTGPTGSGKTTTIAAMIDHINESKAVNIVTVEDPIEVLHPDKKSIVNQREIGTDTEDYGQAMKRVLRQDPDAIFIGEMRDPDTVWAALSAAETGHLVLSTLHTTDATETVNRIVDFFPPFQQKQVRLTLASSLRGVVSQRLLERADGTGRGPATELLVMTGRLFDRIVDPESSEAIEEIITEGEYYGMQTFDQSLFNLYKNGLVSLRDAMSVASHPHDFRIALQQAGLSAQ